MAGLTKGAERRLRALMAAFAAAMLAAGVLTTLTAATFQDIGDAGTQLASHPRSLQAVGANDSGQLGVDTGGADARSYLLSDPSTALPGLVTSAGVGAYHGCAVSDGRAYCWGENATGQLGTGSVSSSAAPVAVRAEPGDALHGKEVREVAVGQVSDRRGSTCASTDSDAGMEIFCWGDNFYGQLGIGAKPHQYLPVKVTGIPFGPSTVVNDLSVGQEYACAVVDGRAWCWGNNHMGRLGNGTQDSTSTPLPVEGDAAFEAAQGARRVTAVTVDGDVTCAIADERAYCWGDAKWGGLGNGSTTASAVTSARPVAVGAGSALPGSARLTDIDATYNGGCALSDAGEVFCWGNNSQGQNGRGGVGGADAARPVQVAGLIAPAVELSAAREASCVRYADGRMACWGDNRWGQLGRGTSTSSGTPAIVAMPSSRPVKGIYGGSRSFLAVQGY